MLSLCNSVSTGPATSIRTPPVPFLPRPFPGFYLRGQRKLKIPNVALRPQRQADTVSMGSVGGAGRFLCFTLVGTHGFQQHVEVPPCCVRPAVSLTLQHCMVW